MTQHVEPDSVSRIEERFLSFHEAHPEVYDALVELANDLLDRGYEKFGIATIYEVARWRSMLRKGPKDSFKLDNNYRAYYARLMMDKEPRLRGIFNTRQLGVPHHVV